MKKTILLSLISVLAFFVSCSDDSDGPEVYENTFKGTLLYKGVELNGDAECGVRIIDNVATVTLYGVSFAPAMPAMDIVIEGLSCAKSDDGYVITGTDVLPSVAGRPVEAYAMSEVTARVSGDTFVLNCETARGAIGFSNENPDSGSELPSINKYGKSYKGELLSGDIASGDESKLFTIETIVDVIPNTDSSSLMDVVLNDVKFAEKMPVALDITLKDIPCTISFGDDGYTIISFCAADVAPYINNEPEQVSAYMFATIEGVIQNNKLQLSAKMANDLAAYVAGMEFVFNGKQIVE